MIDAQQPYIPVCLMTAAVIGSEYDYHLVTIRSFRDKMLLGKMGYGGGILTDMYYNISQIISPIIYKNKALKKLVLHGFVRPLGHVLRKLL